MKKKKKKLKLAGIYYILNNGGSIQTRILAAEKEYRTYISDRPIVNLKQRQHELYAFLFHYAFKQL